MTHTVTKAYTSAYPDPITAKRGDRLVFERRESEWPGWIWCIASGGAAGWIPESWVVIDGDDCVMQRDYTAVELTVAQGDVVTVVRKEAGWAWARNESGEEGWLPLDRLQATA